ncbi:MAG: pentapeptide repeat-containing protein [Bacteroidota bacterium]
MQFIAEKTFEKLNFKLNPLEKGEYELCIFKVCDFSDADLSGIKFIECEFVDCNLSNAKISDVILRDASFNNCKLIGLMFNTCNSFGFSVGFNGCNLSHSSFYQKKLKGAVFKNSRLQEVDFTESDLTNAVFENCDFLNATFEKTILEKTDFRSSFNYSINPDLNKIKKAKFSLSGIEGLLHHIDIEIDRHS